jgi:hypothetical protein
MFGTGTVSAMSTRVARERALISASSAWESSSSDCVVTIRV